MRYLEWPYVMEGKADGNIPLGAAVTVSKDGLGFRVDNSPACMDSYGIALRSARDNRKVQVELFEGVAMRLWENTIKAPL